VLERRPDGEGLCNEDQEARRGVVQTEESDQRRALAENLSRLRLKDEVEQGGPDRCRQQETGNSI
jgi:hypothetical protein